MACAVDEQLGWFCQLGKIAGQAAGKVKSSWGDAVLRRTTGAWRSFELADIMEQGLAREVTTAFATPPRQGLPSRHLVVHRSEDRTEHVLESEDGDPLLVARGAKGTGSIDIYIPLGGDPPIAVGPAFTLATSGEDEECWTLTSNRCECCEYLPQARACCASECKRELAHIYHRREKIGQGTVMCMEVDIPALRADGTPSVWCRRAAGEWASVALESRRPTWSARLKSLTLDFYGRCSRASAKNFQLQMAGQRAAPRGAKQESELLFGKIADDDFVLDYKHPLSMAQAFAIALSTKDWQ